jgi:DNA topoisomerase-1
VIVESPTKAKTINQYLGHDFVVMASVGHVRDLPSRSPKGQKQEVPGVDLEHNFQPTYEVLPEKKKTVTDLRKAAKEASDVWFATDLDREGEAIAWHLAQALGVPPDRAKRVVFNAITKAEIGHAFANPRPIDQHKVDAQQARRILDRIVGYQVSPLLWKKVAGGLSAGRVQSVAVRLVVEREREIEAFVPEEFWKITGYFATDLAARERLASAWRQWLTQAAEGKERTLKEKLAWLSEHRCLRAELVEVDGKPFEAADRQAARRAAERLGLVIGRVHERHDPNGKGPAAHLVVYEGHLQSHPGFVIRSVQTKRTTSRPSAPFITSTMQQAAANRLGFSLKHTMDIAQQLYEGVDLHGSQGRVGLITYMRTDSTHLSPEALEMARSYIQQEWGDRYLPAKPQQYASSNKSAQEAHEAIRPTDVRLTPKRVRGSLTEHQYRLYQLVWERFVASQMTPAEWDSTTVIIGTEPAGAAFKATGRTLVFDGFYKAAGLPSVEDEAVLPALMQGQPVAPLQIDPTQHFTSPPPRYTEASLQKKLEEEGIGRPSTYAAIIQTIQDRKYVQKVAPGDRRLYATDLGKVVTDKLIEGFPRIMDVAYTRTMEAELDKIEEKHLDWVTMLRRFYGPFKENLDTAHQSMTHAKAQTEPAPFKCEKCGAPTVYRFGRNGRFLSCSRYPDCDFAAPIGRDGKPVTSHLTDIVCPVCGAGMTRRTGRFGPFLGCENYPKCKGVVKLDPKKGTVVLPKPPPLQVDVPCPKCGSALNLRRTKRGPWLSCSRFPKCRGRLPWSALEPAKQAELEQALAAHEAANPVPVIRTVGGRTVGEGYVPRVQESDGVSAAAPEASEVGSDAA